MTAADLMLQLEADPVWVASRDAASVERARREQESRIEQAPLLRDLSLAGTPVNNVWDLVNRSRPYVQALPVLLDHLARPYSSHTLEGIARSLATKAARPIAWATLLTMMRERALPREVADGVMVAICAMAHPADLACLIGLVEDASIGPSRIFIVRRLMRSKRAEARQALLRLRHDPDLRIEIAARLKLAV
jgi:hypothetical protein